MKKWKYVYVILFLSFCLFPLAGLPFSTAQGSSENRELASFPSVRTEGGAANLQFLSEAGDYFQEHFAFRDQLVTLHARVMDLFGTSADDGVIRGRDGWLYYMDSLKDYQGTSALSDRELYNIAHSFRMAQDYLASRQIRFLYVPVPNKNTLYGENMPYYYDYKVSQEHNLLRLYPFLDAENVAWLDLYSLLKEQPGTLYHVKDSHWTSEGAALAADAIMDALGKEHDAFTDETFTVRQDYEGDLETMLHPWHPDPDSEVYYDRAFTYQYVEEIDSTFDPKINTVNEQKTGDLIMYRDSFGNALVPFIAEEYRNAYFSRTVPYPLTDLDKYPADTVIMERVERFLPDMAEHPSIIPALRVPGLADEQVLDSFTVSFEQEEGPCSFTRANPYLKLEGFVDDEALPAGTQIYLRLNGEVLFEAIPTTVVRDDVRHPCGYTLYLSGNPEEEPAPVQVEVLTGQVMAPAAEAPVSQAAAAG
ncbi:MAG: hypothetical protein IJX90_01015 [Blautia sp.]|nr:hypothetical protein [Blautia sp.]